MVDDDESLFGRPGDVWTRSWGWGPGERGQVTSTSAQRASMIPIWLSCPPGVWNGTQLKTAFQLHSNFVPIGPGFRLPLPDLNRYPGHGQATPTVPASSGWVNQFGC